MARDITVTGGRPATSGVIEGRWALSVGKPKMRATSGFRWTALTDVARLESGHTPSRSHPEYWNGDIPWIGIRDATGNHGRVIERTNETVTALGIEKSSARVLPQGTVCLSRTASVGFVVSMGAPMATSQDFINWVCGPMLNARYLHYLLMCEQASIRRFAHGTTHQTVYYPEAKAFHVCIPERFEQDLIARLLQALDDKLAVSEQICRISDELRAFRLRRWMQEKQSSTTAVPLSSLASFANGRPFTKDATGTGRVVVRIAEITSGLGNSTVYNDIEVGDVNLARPGDVLFAWSGSLTVARWYRPDAIINQHIFKVIPNPGIPVWLAYELVRQKLDYFKVIAAGKATTMGHIQRHHLDEEVHAPCMANIGALDAELGPLWDRALAAERESLVLGELRDTLLPRLMSGEIRVRDAERIVEDVT
jgi:type I restriction enzyme, S subunit